MAPTLARHRVLVRGQHWLPYHTRGVLLSCRGRYLRRTVGRIRENPDIEKFQRVPRNFFFENAEGRPTNISCSFLFPPFSPLLRKMHFSVCETHNQTSGLMIDFDMADLVSANFSFDHTDISCMWCSIPIFFSFFKWFI